MTSYTNGLRRMQVLRPTVIRDITMYASMLQHIQGLVLTNDHCIKSRYTLSYTQARTHAPVCLLNDDQSRNMDYNSTPTGNIKK